MTPAQLQTLGAYIAATPALAAIPNNNDGAFEVAAALNVPANPAFIVWKSRVTTQEMGQAFSSSELSGLTTANTSRLQVMEQYSGGWFNPSRADTRAGFDAIFSGAGGVNTRAAMLVLWKRSATVGEKVLATGAGSDALPALLGFEGAVSPTDVSAARGG